MPTQKQFHCIVDDTALTTNIEEIEEWIQGGLISLIVPLHTLERLHLLKKDASQIGHSARKAVKFLDQITSSENLPPNAVVIQGPEDQYRTWQEVEAHYLDQQKYTASTGADEIPSVRGGDTLSVSASQPDHNTNAVKTTSDSRLTLEKLDLKESGKLESPVSTPPMSPVSSGIPSAKTSPEVQNSRLNEQDASPVPPMLKALINPVVWYIYEKNSKLPNVEIVFLTNSSDTALIAKDFGVSPKTIHQLRQSISKEELERKNQDKYHKKHPARPVTPKSVNTEPPTLFSYDEGSSEDDELLFKPKTRGTPRTPTSSRGQATGNRHSRRASGHSPSNSMSTPAIAKPQIPTEEIDPDSFDRGGFARGSTPLANVGSPYTNYSRGTFRGNHAPSGPRGSVHRGTNSRGSNTGRGRGRLFVP